MISKHYSNQPIYTLPVLNSRLYLVNDPALAASVQRSKTLSFNPLIPNITQRVLGFDDATRQIIATGIDRDGTNGPRGFYPDMQDLVYGLLGPGDALNELTLVAAREFSKELDAYAMELGKPEFANVGKVEDDLLLWIRHIVTVVTARFLFGPHNPIARIPQLEESFWNFDHGIPGLLVGLLPKWTARKAYFGREALVRALMRYIDEGSYRDGCELIQRRIEIAEKHGFSVEAVAREELTFLFAGIVNTAMTSYWMVLHIYARPDLLKEVRAELEKCVEGDGKSKSVSVHELKDKCELLMSIYREVLRLESDVGSTRMVTADTILNDQYFLKKNSTLIISGGTMHQLKSVWGDDVDDFNARRFIQLARSKELHPAAFRAFGGGSTLCPGRHFATNEILLFVALIVLRFDVEHPTGKELAVPGKMDDVLPVHVFEPENPVQVNIKPRSGWDDMAWYPSL